MLTLLTFKLNRAASLTFQPGLITSLFSLRFPGHVQKLSIVGRQIRYGEVEALETLFSRDSLLFLVGESWS